MKYTVKKDGFVMEISKERENIILSVDYDMIKEYYTLVKDMVFKLIKGEWKMLNTKGLKYEKDLLKNEKGVLDLTQVISMFPIEGHYLVLNRDEIYFLQALIYDLLVHPQRLTWLPIGTEYIFEGGYLKSIHNGWQYEYELPALLGIKDLEHPIY